MRVLSLPDYTLHNPYQWLLARALHERGVEVTHSDGIGRWPVHGAVRAYGRPDVVHLHWPERFLGRRPVQFLGELLWLRLRGVRVVWTAHNLRAHEGRHRRLERLGLAALARIAHCVIVHSTAAKESVARHLWLGRTKVLVIAHGRYDDAYPLTMTRADARRSLQLPTDARVFLAFGQLRRYRGTAELLDAFAALDDARARLLVVGRPADEALAVAVEAAAATDDRVLPYLGQCADDEVQRFFLAADAVVLPYRDVLTSGVAVLAARFGRACVIPTDADLHNLLPSAAVLAYDRRQPGDLRAALDRAMESDLAAAGRAMTEAAFPSWAQVAEQTAQVYGHSATSPASDGFPVSAWSQRLTLARDDVTAAVPPDAAVTLVDDGSLIGGLSLLQPSCVFPERDGVPWGPPASDSEAVRQLDGVMARGSRWLVVPWASFWWFDVYPRFAERLETIGTCVRRTDRVAIYELRGDRHAA